MFESGTTSPRWHQLIRDILASVLYTHTHTHTEVETCPLSSLYCHWFQSESLIQHFLNHLKLSTIAVSELLAYYCQSILLCQLAVQAEEGRVYHSLGPSGSAGLGNGMIGSRDQHRVMSSSSAGCGWRSHHALRLSQCTSCYSRAV